jgi:hypothetical protein
MGFGRIKLRGQDFHSLTQNTAEWVEKWTDCYIDDETFSKCWIDSLNRFSRLADPFRKALYADKDLSSAVGYPDNDQHILSAHIVRFVWRKLFAGASSSHLSSTDRLLQTVARTMQLCTTPGFGKSRVFSTLNKQMKLANSTC